MTNTISPTTEQLSNDDSRSFGMITIESAVNGVLS
jgi:hypothetical protein